MTTRLPKFTEVPNIHLLQNMQVLPQLPLIGPVYPEIKKYIVKPKPALPRLGIADFLNRLPD
jgi:hypothetical protein